MWPLRHFVIADTKKNLITSDPKWTETGWSLKQCWLIWADIRQWLSGNITGYFGLRCLQGGEPGQCTDQVTWEKSGRAYEIQYFMVNFDSTFTEHNSLAI